MSPRLGTLFLCAFVASLALTWLGCSEEDLSPIAPSRTTAATAPVDRASSSQAKPNGPVETGFHPQIAVEVDGSFHPTATPNAGFDGATGSPVTPTIVLDRGPAPLVPPIPALKQAGPGAPSVDASGGFDDASPEAAVAQVNHDPAAAEGEGEGAAELKASAPIPVEPINDIELPELTPVLTVTNADGLFVDAMFEYEFAVYKVAGGSRTEVEVASRVPGGNATTSYRVTERLDRGAAYVWRARAFLDGAHGPWSEDASFRTAEIVLGAPRPLAPIDGAVVDIDTHFAVRNPTVEGRNRVVGRVYIEIQVASDDGFVDVVATGRTHERSRGQTNVAANRTLAPSTQYYWRARATASTRAAGQVASIWSRSAAFRTSAVRLGVPRPLAPIDGATVGVNAQFRVRNGTVVGISSRAFVEIEVALTDSFANAIAGRTHMRPRGETIVPLPDRLMPHRRYYWRARVAAGALFSDWSATANFRTSSDTTTSGPAGPFGPGGSPRNMLRILQEVASRNADALRNSCQEEGGSWRFMELAVERLRQETGRWGYNCKRGNCADVSHDAIAYYRGSGTTTSAARGSTDVAIIDIIVGHCGPNPQPGWGDVTQATADAGSVGRWKYPR